MKKITTIVALSLLCSSQSSAQTRSQVPYAARAFIPAHTDLARSAGVPAQLANQDYVAALARVVYYWGYPAVDGFGRTNMWEIMKAGSGAMRARRC